MKTNTKRKLCWNCEGNVSKEKEICPYCGVSLEIGPIAGTEPNGSGFKPLFRNASPTSQNEVPQAPYSPGQENGSSEIVEAQEEEESLLATDASFSLLQSTLLTLLALQFGVILMIFGILLFLFSEKDGIFSLQWHASYWYLYLLAGLPLLYFGLRTLNRIDEI
jgi:hypothetical protein